MRFRVEAAEKLDLADELIEEFRKEASAVVREAGDMLVEEIQRNLQKVTGRVSAPGEPPAYQTGDLMRSFKRGRTSIGRDKASVSTRIESTEPWEVLNALEYGVTDENGVRLLPRPYRRPAEKTVEPRITALFEERL